MLDTELSFEGRNCLLSLARIRKIFGIKIGGKNNQTINDASAYQSTCYLFYGLSLCRCLAMKRAGLIIIMARIRTAYNGLFSSHVHSVFL
jgi:hypothetical protein